MKMTDLISNILDLFDRPAEQEQPELVIISSPDEAGQSSPLTHAGDDINRFRQIVDLRNVDSCETEYANEPNEQYASIEAVTTHAGGGMNGPKHAHDIRVKDPSAYPNQQEF